MEKNNKCEICRRPLSEWLLKLTVEDAAGYDETAWVCTNCGVKLRLASERSRDLQIDPWVHEAVARVLRGK
jgi:RNase P subunit RPR2